jgi:hypothetical protein
MRTLVTTRRGGDGKAPRGVEGNSSPRNVGESSISSAVAGISCSAALALNPGVAVDEVLQSLPIGEDEELAVQLDIPEASRTNSVEAKPEEVLMQSGDPRMSGDVSVVAKIDESSEAQVGVKLGSEEFEVKELDRDEGAAREAGSPPPDKAGLHSSPTCSAFSSLSSSITSFVEDSGKDPLGSCNAMRHIRGYRWTSGPEEGDLLSIEHGMNCLETNPGLYNDMLEPIYKYEIREHKDCKEIQEELGDVRVAEYGTFLE